MAEPRTGARRAATTEGESDALPAGRPAWAARALVWLISLVLVASLLAGFLVPLERTIEGSFLLVPAQAPTTIVAPTDGFLEQNLADEGSAVSAEEVLFKVRLARETGVEEAAVVEIRSPVAGVVVAGAAGRAGDRLESGQMLAQVAAVGSPVVAEIVLPEEALADIEPGQAVQLVLAAYARSQPRAIEAVIRRVNPVAVQSAAGYVVKALAEPLQATFAIRGEERPLLAGLRGRARIVVDRRPLLGGRAAVSAPD